MRYLDKKTDLECDFLSKVIEDRIDYEEAHGYTAEELEALDAGEGLGPIVSIERERERRRQREDIEWKKLKLKLKKNKDEQS